MAAAGIPAQDVSRGVGKVTTLANVESRYPGLIHRFQETTVIEEDGDYQEVANIIEFGEYSGEGGQLYQQIRSTP